MSESIVRSVDVFTRLSATLIERRHADPASSYTAKLYANGPDSILKKIGEESAELIVASKNEERVEIVFEATDLIFHIMTLLAFHNLSIDDVRRELAMREGVSGIDEKQARHLG
jgi:phosphoribosyl-ATP pyrophosphohydrolase